MKKGFTLIELLVVVLIIGILAAIALPQYTKAIERSRMAEAMQRLGDLATAQSIYYMQNGEFANESQILNGDISFASFNADGNAYTYRVDYIDNDLVCLKARRKAGMYVGKELELDVYKDGELIKRCHSESGSAFCTWAKTMGYDRETGFYIHGDIPVEDGL